jgi:hypothetical protein
LPRCAKQLLLHRKPLRDPYAGPRRRTQLRQARAARPIRSSSRSQTRAHAHHVAAFAGPTTVERVDLIRFGEIAFQSEVKSMGSH